MTDPSRPEIWARAKGRDEAGSPGVLGGVDAGAAGRGSVPSHGQGGAAFWSACAAGVQNSKSVLDRFHVANKRGEAKTKSAAALWTALSGVLVLICFGPVSVNKLSAEGRPIRLWAAIPFFGNTLLGDVIYTVLLFGGPALAEKWMRALRESSSGAMGRATLRA